MKLCASLLTLRQFPGRTFCSMFALTLAFFSFFFFRAAILAYGGTTDQEGSILVVGGIGAPLPPATLSSIEIMDGVRHAIPMTRLGQPYYQKPQQPVRATGVPPEAYSTAFRLALADTSEGCFHGNRMGMVATKSLVEKYAWREGDIVPLTSTFHQTKDGGRTWPFVFCGVFGWPDVEAPPPQVLFDYEYMQEFLSTDYQVVLAGIAVVVARGTNPTHIARDIDIHFRNSPTPTRTLPIHQLRAEATRRIGDVGMLAGVLGTGLFASLFLVNHSLWAQSLRDRSLEMETLHAIGFSRFGLGTSMCFEYALMLVGASVLAAMLAIAVYPEFAKMVESTLGPINVAKRVVVETLALSGFLGVVMGGIAGFGGSSRIRGVTS